METASGRVCGNRWYLETAKVAFRRRLTYRAAAVAGMVTNLTFGVLRAYAFRAVAAAAGGSVGGYAPVDLNTFTMLTQVLLSAVAVWSHIDLPQSMRTGEIATDYCKPVSLYSLYGAREAGRAVHDLVLRGVPLLLGYVALMALRWPRGPEGWAMFATSVVLGWLVCYPWRFLVGAIAFWTLDVRGPGALLFTVAMLLMGFLMPVSMFPHWLQVVAHHTPFPSIIQTPMDIYLGKLAGPSALRAMAIQVAWAVALWVLAHVCLSAGEKRMVAQGG